MIEQLIEKEYTLIMIKPDAVQAGYSGAILERIEKEAFSVRALKKIKLSKEQAGSFYNVHKERPFYDELTSFMSSGPVLAAVLERDNVITHWRNVIGATDPAEADEGTIRKQFAKSKGENAVHGSDSVENARLEAAFFFSALDLA